MRIEFCMRVIVRLPKMLTYTPWLKINADVRMMRVDTISCG